MSIPTESGAEGVAEAKGAAEAQLRTEEAVAAAGAAAGHAVPVPSQKEERRRRLAQFLGEVGHVERFDFSAETNVEPGSHLAERYRSLRSCLQTLRSKQGVSTVLMSSCNHSEGKTVSSINLARYMAKNVGQKVALVDCDLRRPQVKRLLNLEPDAKGLDDVLLGKASLHEATLFSHEDNLAVIPTRRGHTNATEMLDTPIMDAVLDTLKGAFDSVILDCTPALSTSDPVVVGQKTDGVLLAVRAGQTQRESVEHAIDLFRQADVRVCGVVLTFVRYYIPRYLSRYQHYQNCSYSYPEESRSEA